jgi:serine/threonine protein kinase/Tfp pilus assembly protein PilF
MTPPRLETVEEIFHAALDCAPDQLNACLDKSCAGDEVLRRKVEELLAAHQQAGSFIETPVATLDTSIVENGQTDLLVGQTIGHYQISRLIGAGGMGEVYLATDIIAGRKAALKLLPARFTADAERLKRFQQEARAVVALNHPNIVTVYEIGEDHSTHYIASELIEGETLRQCLIRGRMDVGKMVDVAIQAANALAAAHATGIVHRDIKPENIMLRPDGYVKVLDFGIAKLVEQEVPATIPADKALLLVETNLGSILGTVRYMSPEQAYSAPVDKRTDIWSLGVILYEMVTGHVPFTGDTPGEVMHSILEKEPPPLRSYIKRTPTELQQIISKTLRKDRRERYQNASEMLEMLKDLHRKLESKTELVRSTTPSWLRRTRSPTALALLLLLLALALAFPFYRHRYLTTSLPSDKSIAVLPFENLNEQKENAAFGDGIQDDILTKLAKIAGLKVISRTSVMDYRGKQNVRQIGNELRVSHVLEGSVRRTGTHLHLNAQLIDTRTDTHVWVEQYDRDLNDLFAIQSEIAQKVAAQLHVKITPAEKQAIQRKPTGDLVAFDLYSRANDILSGKNSRPPDFAQAVDLLNRAVARDPSFLEAYCQLAFAHDQIYFDGIDRTPARLAMAKDAIDSAFRLKPDSGEAHLAQAVHFYRGYLDYDGALAELEIARQTLPNQPRIFQLMGFIQRRQGHWEASRRNLERAAELDPRDLGTLEVLSADYARFRRYAEAKTWLIRAIAVAEPDDISMKLALPEGELEVNADPRPLHQAIDSIRATNPAAGTSAIAHDWLFCALAERDGAAATQALSALNKNEISLADQVSFNRHFVEGLIARMRNDERNAQLAFAAARAEQEKIVEAQPDFGPAWCVLGMIDAGLGRKEEALREGRRALELLPLENDALVGQYLARYFAVIAAWVGEKDLACEQLAVVVQPPSNVSYGELKLMPWWDPLRGDPRFEKIVASLAPKESAVE